MRSSSSMWRSRPTARRRTRSRAGRPGRTGAPAACLQVGPALAAVVDVVEVEARLVEEAGQVEVGARPGAASAAPRPSPASATGSPRAGCAARSRWPSGRAACGSRPAGTGTAAARPARRPGGCRRAGPGSGGRSGTPGGACPRSRAPCRTPCPGVLRRPRPSCWRNSVGLSVGRSMSTVSTAGTSTPSLNRSTENTARTRRRPGPAGRPRARSCGLSPQIGHRRRCRGG